MTAIVAIELALLFVALILFVFEGARTKSLMVAGLAAWVLAIILERWPT